MENYKLNFTGVNKLFRDICSILFSRFVFFLLTG
jgi:hypothetical protein